MCLLPRAHGPQYGGHNYLLQSRYRQAGNGSTLAGLNSEIPGVCAHSTSPFSCLSGRTVSWTRHAFSCPHWLLESPVTFFFFPQQKEEPPLRDPPPPREQGATYSAETGRLIPASSQALTRRNRQSQRGHPSSKDGGVQPSTLQDQELLVSPALEARTAMNSASRFLGLPSQHSVFGSKTVRPERPCPKVSFLGFEPSLPLDKPVVLLTPSCGSLAKLGPCVCYHCINS